MRNELNEFNALLSTERAASLRQNGFIAFDVDDTLLARRGNTSENDQVFSESEAALAIPLLLNAGIRVCVITGHGLAQLQQRLVAPLLENVTKRFPKNRNEILKRFFVYANRGATKLIWANDGFVEDEIYGDKFSFLAADLVQLREILEQLEKTFSEEFNKNKDWYFQNFPKFAFDELPPQILEREKVVLGLRPIPSKTHAAQKDFSSPRRQLFLLGNEYLRSAALDAKYELVQSGKSTLEINNRNISKKAAFEDLIIQVAAEKKIAAETVEKSSIYVGDEFTPDGNDFIISQSFVRARCFSVAVEDGNFSPENVVFLHKYMAQTGISATAALISRILKVLT